MSLSKRHLRRKIANETRRTLGILIEKDTNQIYNENLFILPSNRPNIKSVSNHNNSNIPTKTRQNITGEKNCVAINSINSNINNDERNTCFAEFPEFSHNNILLSNADSCVRDDSKLLPIVNQSQGSVEENQMFVDNFRAWAVNNNITHKAINDLMHLLKGRFNFLPKDARTILGTPVSRQREILDNGELIYLGLEASLQKRISQGIKKDSPILLSINIDGLPIFNNSDLNFWPILARSDCFHDKSPFPIAVFCGVEKPNPLHSFLESFIAEYNKLGNQIVYEGTVYFFTIHFFTCDAPARAFLKQIIGHNGKHGCERCTICASRENCKLYFPTNCTFPPRQDADFLSPDTSNHIKAKSPLLDLNIGLVSRFVLDPMHLIYLGVMKRTLVNYMIEGRRPYKLSTSSKKIINAKLAFIKKFIPFDFPRKIRTLATVKKWKAVELRFFLLYCGPFVLRDVLGTEYYEHFLLLHAAVYIFSNKKLIEKYFNVAKEFLEKFINVSSRLYDKYFVTYNVHSLSHVADDVEHFGCLEDYGCFSFESYLGQLKRKIRGTYLPLSQLTNRLQEMENACGGLATNPTDGALEEFTPSGISHFGNYYVCEKLSSNNLTISVKTPNNFICTQTNNICRITNIICKNNSFMCTADTFGITTDFYKKPIKSSLLGINFIRGSGHQITFNANNIAHKLVAFPYKDGFYTIPISHQKNNIFLIKSQSNLAFY